MRKRNFLILLIAILGFSNAELFAMTQEDSSKEHGSNTFILPDDPDETITPPIMMEVLRYSTSIFGFIPENYFTSRPMEEIVNLIDNALELTPHVSEFTLPFVGITFEYQDVERLYILDRKVDIATLNYTPDKDFVSWSYFFKFDDKEEVCTYLRLLLRTFTTMGYDPTIGRHLSFTTDPRPNDEGYIRTVHCAYTDIYAGSLFVVINVTLRKDP